MDELIYTVEQASLKLKLHQKTVLRFIKEGRIKANKVGREWRIKESDLISFINGFTGETKEVPESKSPDIETTSAGQREKIQVSSVIDIFVEDYEEATRLSNTFVAVLNCKDDSYGKATYNFIYYPEEKKARFILWGTPKFISMMLGVFTEIGK